MIRYQGLLCYALCRGYLPFVFSQFVSKPNFIETTQSGILILILKQLRPQGFLLFRRTSGVTTKSKILSELTLIQIKILVKAIKKSNKLKYLKIKIKFSSINAKSM